MTENLKYRIDSLSFSNVREFEDISLNFVEGINPLLLRNGYGKTTILTMLRWMFTGKIPPKHGTNWPQYKRDFGGDLGKSEVVLDLSIQGHEGKMRPWKLTMWFNHNDEDCGFITYSAEIGGKKQYWALPAEFRNRFFERSNFTELFIFNGETADVLAGEQNRNQVESAIMELTSLIFVDDLCKEGGQLDDQRTKLFREAALTDPENAYAKYFGWKEKIDSHIVETTKKKATTTARIKKLSNEIANIDKDIDKIADNDEAQEKLNAENKKLGGLTTSLKSTTKDLLAALGNPGNIPNSIWRQVENFHNNLAEAKVPEGVGRQFFIDLKKQDKCVCGEDFTEKMRTSLDSRIDQYLADEVMHVVKEMQNHVSTNADRFIDLEEETEKIDDIHISIRQTEEEILRIKRTFDSITQDKLKTLEGKKDSLETEQRKLQTKLDEITESDPLLIATNGYGRGAIRDNGDVVLQYGRAKNCINLTTLKRIQKQLQTKLEEIGPLQHMSRGVDLANEIISEAISNIMVTLRKKVAKDTNTLLAKIPGTGGGIKLSLTGERLAFIDENGKQQDGANMGAILSGAYCFISALASLGSITPVLVADSPVTGMDNATSEAWSKEIWPFFDQAILILTPGEREMILQGPNGVGRDQLNSLKHFITVMRSDEDLHLAIPQTGQMQVDYDKEVFFDYMSMEE
jgi:predicted ATP-dependent endonuclease of OLD family